MLEGVRDPGAPARLIAFSAALALVGGVAALAGAAVGDGRVVTKDTHGNAMAMAHLSPADESRASGLASVAAGYTFAPVQTTLPLGKTTAFRFRILDTHGKSVDSFRFDGGVRLHLILVRRDLVGYQHVHPTPRSDGLWSVPLTLAAPGVYRVYADFDVGGKKTVLGQDLFVGGSFTPASLPSTSTEFSGDGYIVKLTHGDLQANRATRLQFAVSRGGRPVAAFDRYVGYRGHLVALRDGDLFYSHVHPEPDAKVGDIVFHAEFPSAGRFRLFLQFKVAGTVHTAGFTVEVRQ